MTHYDLVIVGAGSGNMIAGHDFSHLRVAIVDRGPFGGTCLNRGCIPSKMYLHTAEVAHSAATGARFDLATSYDGADWPAIRERIMGRVDENAESGREGQSEKDWVDVVVGEAHFTGPRQLVVHLADGGETELTADQVVIATGTRPTIPPIDGLDDLSESDRRRVHTSDSVMRLSDLPASMAVIGGGYVGSELAHVFASLGTAVTQVESEDVLLASQDREVAEVFTREVAERYDVRCGAKVVRVEPAEGDGLLLTLDDDSTLTVECLLLAVGRRANSDVLAVEKAGVDTYDDGRVKVDDQQRTSAEGVFALGDASTGHPLKHVANHEARVVRHNLLNPDDLQSVDHRFVPQAVFASPQVASVGLTEAAARDEGIDLAVGRTEYADTAHGWAYEEDDRNGPATGHVVKLLADRATGLLVGAHLVGPQASVLIQPLLTAMAHDLPVKGLARSQYWIHPALTEVVEGALLDLERALRH
ncbi:mycothione reductase [Nocardioides sp. CFH 31398]|uniref:mycothione reductase n=1 Tax=Nocardioides sp. CFH 31398 TaxID=2919579 RepID=UPI001F0654CE|nr:mycothione reductase [Nocardioides sp. CFH 31398]MCH1865355.1 mycothione reductase [Nocardioides sp. CFH 31398]MCH1868739.1 mycothione reductase [Nocardioides sp. CFH 31398]